MFVKINVRDASRYRFLDGTIEMSGLSNANRMQFFADKISVCCLSISLKSKFGKRPFHNFYLFI